MSVFEGAGVAIVTPMHEDGTVNFEKMGEIIDMQIAAGTDAIIVCGTTGEASTLSHGEHLAVIQYAVEKAAKRVPVIAGTGSNSTKTAIYLSSEAEKRGVDAELLVSPYYNKTTQDGLRRHFMDTARAVSVPVLLYNIPGRTGCNILPETVAWLVRNVENIVGVKEASGDIEQVARMMSIAGDEIELYAGNDAEIVPIMSLGGSGVISVLSNIAPGQTHEIASSFLAGDVKKSCQLQLEAMELIDALFCEVNPIPVKTAMNLMGMNVGPLRAPLYKMEDAHVERLKKAMKNYGL